MDEKSFKLLKFMQEEFGDLGPAFVAQELKELGFETMDNLDEENQELLVERIVKNVFAKNMSAQKLAIKKVSLQSIMREKNIEHTEKRQKTKSLLGIPKISFEFENSNKDENQKPLSGNKKNVKEISSSDTKKILAVSIIVLAIIVFIFLAATDIFGILELENQQNKTINESTEFYDAEIANNSQNNNQNMQVPDIKGTDLQNPELNKSFEDSQNFPNDSQNPDDFLKHSDTQTDDTPDFQSPDTPEIGNTPDLNDSVGTNFSSPQNISSTCDESMVGKIFFDISDLHFYGCDGLEWKQLDN